jgi:hypothetical protein
MANCGGALTLGILLCICRFISANSCYDSIKSRPIPNGPDDKFNIVGGYQPISNPGADDDVQSILKIAVKRLNAVSSGNRYTLDRDNQNNVQQLEAFRQVVAGYNYCVRFRVRLVRGDANAQPTKICDVAAHRGINQPIPLIASNGGGVSCN